MTAQCVGWGLTPCFSLQVPPTWPHAFRHLPISLHPTQPKPTQPPTEPPTTHRPPPTTHHPPPTIPPPPNTYQPPTTIHYPSPTTHHPPPITQHPPPTTFLPPPTNNYLPNGIGQVVLDVVVPWSHSFSFMFFIVFCRWCFILCPAERGSYFASISGPVPMSPPCWGPWFVDPTCGPKVTPETGPPFFAAFRGFGVHGSYMLPAELSTK